MFVLKCEDLYTCYSFIFYVNISPVFVSIAICYFAFLQNSHLHAVTHHRVLESRPHKQFSLSQQTSSDFPEMSQSAKSQRKLLLHAISFFSFPAMGNGCADFSHIAVEEKEEEQTNFAFFFIVIDDISNLFCITINFCMHFTCISGDSLWKLNDRGAKYLHNIVDGVFFIIVILQKNRKRKEQVVLINNEKCECE